MPGMPWPHAGRVSASLWDRCSLGEDLLPGFVEVSISGGIEVDVAKAGDKHGASVKLKGAKPRKVKIKWRIWDPKDWEQMQTILEKLEAPEGKKVLLPQVIFHPATFARQIDSIVVTDIDGPKWDRQGFMSVDLDAIEYNPPAPSAKGIGKAGPPKTTSGSEWVEAPHVVQIYVDENGNQVAVKAGAPLPAGVHIETRTVEGETVLKKSAPDKTAAGPF